MMKKIALAGAAILASLCATTAQAAVRYDFEAFTSTYSITGKFSYTAPTFLTQFTIPVNGYDSCSAQTTNGAALSCATSFFDNISFGGNDLLGFGVGNTSIYYYFADLAFSKEGTYDTIILGSEQSGRLTVTEVSAGGAVPEPASWAMMIVGFGIAGGFLRARPRPVTHAIA